MTRCLSRRFYDPLRCSLLLLAIVLATASTLQAQTTTATLSGTVEDQNGASVPGVMVTIVNKGTQLTRETTTNTEGYFIFPLLSPGEYTLRAQGQGFAPAEFPNVILNVGDQKSLQIQLKAGNISEMVQVNADAPLVNESPAVATVVDRQFVENIPLNGRSLQSLITLTPGVVTATATAGSQGQFSVNGQRANANYFTVDGVSANIASAPSAAPGQATSGTVPGLTTFGSTNNLVSIDALQEFTIQSSTYSAQYGRSPGGQISLVTRSGTTDFHGSLFEYFRNEALDANDWFANRAGNPRFPLRQNQFGGTFSGPIVTAGFGEGTPAILKMKRSFFFFSYEGLRLRLPQFVTSQVPTRCLRGLGSCGVGQQSAPTSMQPFLNAYPLPNGRGLGNGLAEFSAGYSNPSSLDATSIRIDHAVNNSLSVFGRYNKAPSRSITRTASSPSVLSATSIDTQTLTLGATLILGPKMSNELLFNSSRNAGDNLTYLDDFGGAVPFDDSLLFPSYASRERSVASFTLSFTGFGSRTLGIGRLVTAPQRQINIVDNFSMIVGQHQLKFGGDYRRLFPIYGPRDFNLNVTFSNLNAVLAGRISSGSVGTSVEAHPIYNNLSIYGQDTWKLSRRLTLDLGLRWELNPAPSEANGNDPRTVIGLDNPATMTLASEGAPLWKTTYTNFAPRIGSAYQLIQKPGSETVIRGGFGVYYDTGNSQGSGGFSGVPFSSSRPLPANTLFPLSPADATPPPPASLTVPYGLLYAFDSDLQLPYTFQWNLAAEQALGANQTLSVSYVAAAGRRLLKFRQLRLNAQPNPVNPLFTFVNATTNGATSDYHSMQIQFQRHLSRGLQALASYTWSHSIDEVSIDSFTTDQLRGDSDFDVRHNFASAITFDLPTPTIGSFARQILSGWSIDAIVKARTATPVSVFSGSINEPDGTTSARRPNLILGVPIYVDDPTVPGGRRFNNQIDPSRPDCFGAFCPAPAGQQGNLGRNSLRGLPVHQVDLAVRRQFKLTEKIAMQLRAEAFNLFNHPNFGSLNLLIQSPTFGQPAQMLNRSLGGLNQLYQIGGPRSLQFALRFYF